MPRPDSASAPAASASELATNLFEQVLDPDGLRDECIAARALGGIAIVREDARRYEHDSMGFSRRPSPELPNQAQSVAVGQVPIEEDDVGPVLGQPGSPFIERRRDVELEGGGSEDRPEQR